MNFHSSLSITINIFRGLDLVEFVSFCAIVDLFQFPIFLVFDGLVDFFQTGGRKTHLVHITRHVSHVIHSWEHQFYCRFFKS